MEWIIKKFIMKFLSLFEVHMFEDFNLIGIGVEQDMKSTMTCECGVQKMYLRYSVVSLFNVLVCRMISSRNHFWNVLAH